MRTILIADSGGTRTDWSLLKANGEVLFFEGRSLHPMYVGENPTPEDFEFWEDKKDILDADLRFFGAGCLNPDNARKIESFFNQLGFRSVHVLSDIHATAYALLENGSGIIAIMGTGSVIAKFTDYRLDKMIGGLGYILGDEGSGFYFGRLLVRDYLENRLDKDLSEKVRSIIGDRATVLSKVYGNDCREFLASLSEMFGPLKSNQIYSLHRQNILLFLEQIKLEFGVSSSTIHFSGSYAFHQKELLKEIMTELELRTGEVVQKPIAKLTEYFLGTTL